MFFKNKIKYRDVGRIANRYWYYGKGVSACGIVKENGLFRWYAYAYGNIEHQCHNFTCFKDCIHSLLEYVNKE